MKLSNLMIEDYLTFSGMFTAALAVIAIAVLITALTQL